MIPFLGYPYLAEFESEDGKVTPRKQGDEETTGHQA